MSNESIKIIKTLEEAIAYERQAILKEIDEFDAGSDCDNNLGIDMSTGASECKLEQRGENCICGDINDTLCKIKRRIMARDPKSKSIESLVSLTKEEISILDLTRLLWNAIVALPAQHSSDIQDTCHDIHNIQNRIMARPFVRVQEKNIKWKMSNGLPI